MKKKSILIIGSSGFFGNSILDYLNKNKSSFRKINKIILLSKSNKNKISKLLKKNYKIEQILGDISKIKKLPYADYIIYCVISKNLSNDEKGVKNYIKLAKKFHRGSKVLYTSSGAIYGKQSLNIRGFSEKYYPKPLNHKSIIRKKYAITKYKNEKLFNSLNKENINVIITRCFAFVGKSLPLNKNFVIGNLIKNIVEKKKLVIKSDKKVLRSYMFADDLAHCLLKLTLSNKTNFNLYNIGSEDKIDIRQLAYKLAKKYKLETKIKKIKNKSKHDTYIPNILKFRKEFNYNKKLDSYKAIIKTIKLVL